MRTFYDFKTVIYLNITKKVEINGFVFKKIKLNMPTIFWIGVSARYICDAFNSTCMNLRLSMNLMKIVSSGALYQKAWWYVCT